MHYGYSENKVIIYNRLNTNWQFDTDIPMNYYDFINGNIIASGDNLVVCFKDYHLQIERKFPVYYYKKIGEQWQLQTYFLGEGQMNMDDRLGNSISLFESNLVIGANREGVINTGKAYYFNLENLSTPTFHKENFTLFPNPTSSIVTIKSNDSSEVKSYELYSVTGKKINPISMENNTISLEDLPTGIYFLKLYFNNDRIENHKIMKQ